MPKREHSETRKRQEMKRKGKRKTQRKGKKRTENKRKGKTTSQVKLGALARPLGELTSGPSWKPLARPDQVTIIGLFGGGRWQV